MKTERVNIKGIHPHTYRCGETAEIVGVRLVKPDDESEWRLCYLILFEDGKTDFVPFSEPENYLIY